MEAEELAGALRSTDFVERARVDQVVESFRSKYGADMVSAYYSKLDAAVEVPMSAR